MQYNEVPRPRRAVFAASRVVTPARDLVPGYLEVTDGTITAVRSGTPRHRRAVRFDGTLSPGLVDLQINGAAGVDFLTCPDEGAVARVRQYLASTGVTAFLPTLVSSPLPALRAAVQRWRAFVEGVSGSAVLGLHLEGPYLNPAFAGAHESDALRGPDRSECEALLGAAPGLVRLLTVAPELPGALDLIRAVRATGVTVALGHTGATAAQAAAAFAAGAVMVTHLFNAMRPIHHRDPGIVVEALRRPDVWVSVIADFVHVDPSLIWLAYKLKGWRKMILVTDAVAAAGTGAPTAVLGTRTVAVTDAARLPDGTLAGSTLALDQAVRNLVSVGVPVREALLMASAVPAAVLARADLGRLAVHTRADFVVWDEVLQPVATFAGGTEVHAR